ncbi:MAG: hypothetical protein ACYTDX_00625 [Planctomycetota bacterium]
MRPRHLLPAIALAIATMVYSTVPAEAGHWRDDEFGITVDLGAGWDVITTPSDTPGERLGRGAARFQNGKALGWLFVYANAPEDPRKDPKRASRLATHLLNSRYEAAKEKMHPGLASPAVFGRVHGLMMEFEVGPAKGEGRTRVGRCVMAVDKKRLHMAFTERPAAGASPAEILEMERLLLSLQFGKVKVKGTGRLDVVDAVPETTEGDALPAAEFRSSVDMRNILELPSGLKVMRQYYLFEGGRLPSYLTHLMGKRYTDPSGKKGKTPDLLLLLFNNKKGKETVTLKASVEVSGYSKPATRTVTVKPGQTYVATLTPVFSDKLYDLLEQRPGAVQLRLEDSTGNEVYNETERLVLLGRNDFFWRDATGRSWAPAVTALITPHDSKRQVDALLRKAKDHCKLGAMVGYQEVSGMSKSQVVLAQMRAVYDALAADKFSYVNAPVSMDAEAQRIKYPTETLEDRAGNCIEAVLVFASAFEAMGMEPVLVLYDDHAQVAVKSWSDDPTLVVFETTLCGRAPFQESFQKGYQRYSKTQKAGGKVELVDVRAWRKLGFTPVPR